MYSVSISGQLYFANLLLPLLCVHVCTAVFKAEKKKFFILSTYSCGVNGCQPPYNGHTVYDAMLG